MSEANSENRVLGKQVEKARARERDGEHVGTGGWFDVEGANGEPVEVKSALMRVEVNWNGQATTRPGRYQIDETNHKNLLDHGGEYDFVLRDSDDTEVDTKTMTAEEVDKILNENDRTWPTGSKLKLSWRDVHPEIAAREDRS